MQAFLRVPFLPLCSTLFDLWISFLIKPSVKYILLSYLHSRAVSQGHVSQNVVWYNLLRFPVLFQSHNSCRVRLIFKHLNCLTYKSTSSIDEVRSAFSIYGTVLDIVILPNLWNEIKTCLNGVEVRIQNGVRLSYRGLRTLKTFPSANG